MKVKELAIRAKVTKSCWGLLFQLGSLSPRYVTLYGTGTRTPHQKELDYVNKLFFQSQGNTVKPPTVGSYCKEFGGFLEWLTSIVIPLERCIAFHVASWLDDMSTRGKSVPSRCLAALVWASAVFELQLWVVDVGVKMAGKGPTDRPPPKPARCPPIAHMVQWELLVLDPYYPDVYRIVAGMCCCLCHGALRFKDFQTAGSFKEAPDALLGSSFMKRQGVRSWVALKVGFSKKNWGSEFMTLLQKHGIDRWLANAVIGITKGRVWLSVIGFFAVTSFLSMWMSNTATTAMMIPIAVALVGSEYPKMRTMLILGTAYAANIGGNGTMVGSPPNGIAVSALDIDFFEWFAVGFPTMLILFPFVIFSLWVIIRPESKIALNKVENVDFEWTPRAKGTVVLFAFTVFCWIFSRPINELLGLKNFDRMIAILITATAPMLGLISWKDLERKIGWGILLLFGGGLCLSKVLTETGTTKFLAESLFLSISGSPTWIVIIACIAVMIFLTEISSNTGSAAIFIPIMIALSDQFSGSVTFALVFGVGLAANCAFMLPVATPPNAIVYGTGYIQQKYMIRAGFLLNIISILVVFLVVSLLLS